MPGVKPVIARKLKFLAENIQSRSADDDVFDPTELEQIARAIREVLPTVEAMELQTVPPVFRVISGGAT
jgi:dTDP-4-dehydrorhamnose reductase